MRNSEWAQFLEDFGKRFPDVGAWLMTKKPTLDLWFSDCFKFLEYTDCRAVSIRLMESGTLNESWNRDKIPAIYRKACGQIRAERERRIAEKQTQQEAKARKAVAERGGVIESLDRSSRACLVECRKLPKEMRRAFIDQYFDSPDPVMTAEAWVEDPSVLITPKRETLFESVPPEDAPY